MPRQNRVTPLGELVATRARGLVYGNRGCLHDDAGRIRRRYAGKRWIACRLEFRGRRRDAAAAAGPLHGALLPRRGDGVRRRTPAVRRVPPRGLRPLRRALARPPPGPDRRGRDRRAAPRGTRRPVAAAPSVDARRRSTSSPMAPSCSTETRRSSCWDGACCAGRPAATRTARADRRGSKRWWSRRRRSSRCCAPAGSRATFRSCTRRRVDGASGHLLAAGWRAGRPAPHPWHFYRNRMARLL